MKKEYFEWGFCKTRESRTKKHPQTYSKRPEQWATLYTAYMGPGRSNAREGGRWMKVTFSSEILVPRHRISCSFIAFSLILHSDETLIMSVQAFITKTFIQQISSITFSGELSKGFAWINTESDCLWDRHWTKVGYTNKDFLKKS